MDGDDAHTPLGHHVGGHGAVDAAGEKAHRTARRAHRQTARPGHGFAVDIGRPVTNLQMDGEFRGVHVGGEIVEGLVQDPAHILA